MAGLVLISFLIFGNGDSEFLQTVERFNLAFAKGNVAELDQMIAQEYLHTNGSSKPIGKDAWMNYVKSRSKKIQSGELIVHHYSMDEVEYQIDGNYAILSARINYVSEESGVKTEKQLRVTHVWIKEDGKWKRKAFQDCRIMN